MTIRRVSNGTMIEVIACTLLAVLVITYSCTQLSPTQQVQQSLNTSQTTYDMILSGLGEMYKEGLIGEEVKQKAIDLGRVWKSSHNLAAETFATYIETKDPEDQSTYLLAMEQTSIALANFIHFARPYLVKQLADEAEAEPSGGVPPTPGSSQTNQVDTINQVVDTNSEEVMGK